MMMLLVLIFLKNLFLVMYDRWISQGTTAWWIRCKMAVARMHETTWADDPR
jgi:hypothetical protein